MDSGTAISHEIAILEQFSSEKDLLENFFKYILSIFSGLAIENRLPRALAVFNSQLDVLLVIGRSKKSKGTFYFRRMDLSGLPELAKELELLGIGERFPVSLLPTELQNFKKGEEKFSSEELKSDNSKEVEALLLLGGNDRARGWLIFDRDSWGGGQGIPEEAKHRVREEFLNFTIKYDYLHKYRKATLLHQIGKLLGMRHNFKRLATRLLSLVRRFFEAETSRLLLFDKSRRRVNLGIDFTGNELFGPECPLHYFQLYEPTHFWSYDRSSIILLLPIRIEDEPIGVIELTRSKNDEFTRDDITIAKAIANPLTLVLFNSMLEEEYSRVSKELRARSASLSLITYVDELFKSGLDWNTLAIKVLELVLENIPAGGAAFLLKTGENFLVTAASGSLSSFAGKSGPVPLIEPIVSRREGTFFSSQELADNSEKLGFLLSEPVFKSLLVAPFAVGEVSHGALLLVDRQNASFDYDELFSLHILASHAARIYESTLLYARSEQWTRMLAMLYRITGFLNDFLKNRDFPQAMESIVRVIAQYMRAVAVSLRVNPLRGNREGHFFLYISEESRERMNAELKRRLEDGLNIENGPFEGGLFVEKSYIGVREERIGELYVVRPAEITFKDSYSGEFMTALSTLVAQIVLMHHYYVEERRLHAEMSRMSALAELGEMAAWVAHEVRNPLGGIKLYATSLASALSESDSKRKWAESIVQACDHLEKIVGGLLSYSKDRKPDRVWFNLSRAIDGILSFLSEKSAARKARIINAVSPSLELLADEELFSEVLMNIILNSLDAIDREGTIRISAIPLDRSRVQLRIDDDGPGVETGDLERIFRPFFTKKKHGTGLGLAIAKRIVESHGGKIHAENLSPRGFSVIIEMEGRMKINESTG